MRIKVSRFLVLAVRTILITSLFFLFINLGLNFTRNLLQLNSSEKIPRDLMFEYNYLKSLLDKPDKKAKTTTDGFSNFIDSEWPLMTLSFFCYGARNLALKDPSLKEDASRYMRKAIERAMKPEYYNFIIGHFGNPFQSDRIKDNAFYLGHFTLMLANYREVSGDPSFDTLFHKFAQAFYENYKMSPTCSLDSYKGYCWTSEQVVPLRALKIHDNIFATHYSEVIDRWESIMKEHFIDQKSGLLITHFDKITGQIFEGPRTIANGFSIVMLYDIIPDFCRNLYINMKRGLMVNRLGFPAFKEYLGNKQYATGDTGPIIWDVSVVSTAFGMGSAAAMDDQKIYQPIRFASDVFGLGATFGQKKKYLVGGAIGTSVIFFTKSLALFSKQQGVLPLKNIIFLYSLIGVIIILLLFGIKKIIHSWRLLFKG